MCSCNHNEEQPIKILIRARCAFCHTPGAVPYDSASTEALGFLESDRLHLYERLRGEGQWLVERIDRSGIFQKPGGAQGVFATPSLLEDRAYRLVYRAVQLQSCTFPEQLPRPNEGLPSEDQRTRLLGRAYSFCQRHQQLKQRFGCAC